MTWPRSPASATLEVSERTAHRDWLYGKAYLRDALADGACAGGTRGVRYALRSKFHCRPGS